MNTRTDSLAYPNTHNRQLNLNGTCQMTSGRPVAYADNDATSLVGDRTAEVPFLPGRLY